MKILLCPDSFKESLTAKELCDSLNKGLVASGFETKSIPLSDGGDGLLDTLVPDHHKVTTSVEDANGRIIEAEIGWIPEEQTLVVESAKANGLDLIEVNDRDPLHASTYGLGQLLMHGLSFEPEQIILGLGGSATNDGGAGMLQAMGFRLLDANGIDIERGNKGLERLDTIESPLNHPVYAPEILIATDVSNPLTGPTGATYTYAMQKGAETHELALMDQNLKHFLNVSEKYLDKQLDFPGAGAAGGLGMSVQAFLRGKAVPGFELVSQFVNLEEAIKWADAVVTGEGKIDQQTLHGKVPSGVLQLAQKLKKPVFAMCAVHDDQGFPADVFNRVISINPHGLPRAESMANAKALAEKAGFVLARELRADHNLS